MEYFHGLYRGRQRHELNRVEFHEQRFSQMLLPHDDYQKETPIAFCYENDNRPQIELL